MKSRTLILVTLIILIFSVLGCQKQTVTNEVLPNKEDKLINIIKPIETDPRTSEYQTKLKEFAFDFDQDNKEENIELYTTAGRSKNGEMLWDDGQKWLLVVVDEDKFYTLYSSYLQLGEVYFTVSSIGEEKTPNVTVLLTTHTGVLIFESSFNKQKHYFEMTRAYEAMDRNVQFISIPSY